MKQIKKHNKFLKALLYLCGMIAMFAGIIGIFIPLLPTVPFLLLASICFVNSSEKVHHFLIHNPWFGNQLRDYQAGKGIKRSSKIWTLSILWISILSSIIFLIPESNFIIKLLLLFIAVAVSIHILLIKTKC